MGVYCAGCCKNIDCLENSKEFKSSNRLDYEPLIQEYLGDSMKLGSTPLSQLSMHIGEMQLPSFSSDDEESIQGINHWVSGLRAKRSDRSNYRGAAYDITINEVQEFFSDTTKTDDNSPLLQ